MDKISEYIEKINRVSDYIEANIAHPITLEDLAEKACLSKYHFHRIFRTFTAESLYGFVNRLRLERSAMFLLTMDLSVTDIAYPCGFNDSASFARAFRKRFGVPPTEYRNRNKSKNRQETTSDSQSDIHMTAPKKETVKPNMVEVETLMRTRIAYVRHTGRYAGNAALFIFLHQQLREWARPIGLLDDPSIRYVVIYHDTLGITDENQLRISVGMTVPDSTQVEGSVGSLHIEEGRYLRCRFELADDEYGGAWTEVYRNVLPREGLWPDDGHCFELYPRDCYDAKSGKTRLDICVPVK